MKYMLITPDHPYNKLLAEEGEEIPVFYSARKIFQPEKTLWPLYQISIYTEAKGIELSVAVKHDNEDWWEKVNHGSPLPFELIPELTSMLTHAYESQGTEAAVRSKG